MSGDVQPRKRKDKKRKKDDLCVEEPRGTAAVLGEGDVFMHSQHDHGTGGHWCAKIVFFSLLAVLITLIGLIILENRGLTELEANSVESRYSGVLEGWLEDAPDDDHHDEHTLELLKQHDDEDDQEQQNVSQEDDHDDESDEVNDNDLEESEEIDGNEEESNELQQSFENDDEDDENDDDDDDEDDENKNEIEQDDENSAEQTLEHTDEADDDDTEQDGDDDDDQAIDEDLEPGDNDDDSANESDEQYDDDDQKDDLHNLNEDDSVEDMQEEKFQNDQFKENSINRHDNDQDSTENDNGLDSQENNNNEESEEHEDHYEEEKNVDAVEVEKLEKEVSDEDQPSQEIEDEKNEEIAKELSIEEDGDDADSVEDEEFLEEDDIDELLPVVERIVVPKGKPLAEHDGSRGLRSFVGFDPCTVQVEDEPTTIKPTDTLAEEEEYERQQEELRKEQAKASHVWLKLVVGGALLVATHAVLSRAVHTRDDTPASEDHEGREDTPTMIDRRMTLIPEERTQAASPKEIIEEITLTNVAKEFKKQTPIVQVIQRTPSEESEEDINQGKAVTSMEQTEDVETEDKELYSDDEELEGDEEEEELEGIFKQDKDIPKQVTPITKQASPIPKQVTPITKQDAPISEKAVESDEDMPEDVEILDDEQLDEELEEEEDVEEEISDVDDAELLSRLEAKYGRLPEPERQGQKHKDGGNTVENDWPGEPSDNYWREQVDEAEQALDQGEWEEAIDRASAAQLKGSARARWTLARAIDASAEAKRDNRLLTRAITAYLDVLKMNEHLSDKRLIEIAERTLDRIRFRGNYMSAEPVYRLLIRRFPDVVDHRNNLTVSLLMANRADLAEEVITETLKKWPDDRIALAHQGFILKTQHNRLEEAVVAFQKALEGDIGPATEPRFYYHLGDAYLLLGRFTEAHEVHKRGAKLGHFLSPAQRSLYNVNRLKSRPWWNLEQTPYTKLAHALEKNWKEILKEGQAAQALYEKEKEGLKERGEWSQLDIFVRGQEVPGRCKKAPITCSIVRSEAAAVGCRRGQIKFSSMESGTHVRPHVGPTNCRLRMHLGLSNTKDTYIRVDQEIRQWQIGKVFMFDDSFEHEVWHNGTGSRLVLIVDVWHPDLTVAERRSLAPI